MKRESELTKQKERGETRGHSRGADNLCSGTKVGGSQSGSSRRSVVGMRLENIQGQVMKDLSCQANELNLILKAKGERPLSNAE